MPITPPPPEFVKEYRAIIWLDKKLVDFSDLDEQAQQAGMREQTKLHITVMGSKVGRALENTLSYLDKPAQDELLKNISDLFTSLNWSFTLTKRYHIKKTRRFNKNRDNIESRESYVQMINMPAIHEYYQVLNKLLNSDLLTQVPHYTMYTRGEDDNPEYYGIPIASQEDFDEMGKKGIKGK